MKSPELLLPVGTRDMLEAAIQNGANAVYYGVPHWNARGRTEDFSFDDVYQMIRYARIRGVKTFLAMNILIFERELQEMPDFLEQIISLEPDAFIVQDIGLARLIKAIAPNQEIHASTQMTLASAEAVNLISKLGFNRAVLSRELSLKQIASIKNATPLELEIFIHGALCVSYSGQCLTSENFGGRSANRGQCAQSCRLPYRIFVDGKEFTQTAVQYLFSPHDLCALPHIKEIQDLGIESLKVEGRLKSAEYVAAVAKAYKKALQKKDLHESKKTSLSAEDMEPLEVLFSRGLKTGWLDGVNHQELVDGTFSNHHGDFLGFISKIERNKILVEYSDKGAMSSVLKIDQAKPRLGDGILFENSKLGISLGGRLYGIKKANNGYWLDLGRDFDFRKIKPHMSVYRNDSPSLEKELHRTFTDRELAMRVSITMNLCGKIGKPLSLRVSDEDGHSIQVKSEQILEIAKNVSSSKELTYKELSALSGSAYKLTNLEIQIDKNAFIPKKILRTLRQNAILQLDKMRCNWKVLNPDAKKGHVFIRSICESSKKIIKKSEDISKPSISVLVRRPEQINALKKLDINQVIMDFDWGVKYDDSLSLIRDSGFKAGIATLRIHKPGENHYLKNILRLVPDFALVRNLGALALLKDNGISLTGDYSLNATNCLSYDWLLSQGLETLHPSWDLNSTQLFDLLKSINGNKLELSLHQYMPAFHSEYCAFARALTSGRWFPECNKICTKHKVEILDHKGERHFLQSDAECRNTLFVGKPQSALKMLTQLNQAGVCHYRIELLDEDFDATYHKVKLYTQAIRDLIDIDIAIKQAGVQEKYGLSEGQLFNENVWENRKK